MSITIERIGKRAFLNYVLLAVVGAFFSLSSQADERPSFVDPAVYYEMVKVRVKNFNQDGSGVLSIEMPDCGGCVEDVVFSAASLLETPFGNYRGFEKLPSWTDKSVLVVVGKKDGIVRRVTVN